MASPANHLLLIDTCGSSGLVALAVLTPEPHLLAEVALPDRGTSERLFPAIRSLFDEPGLQMDTLTAIAIVHGPGSFTGIRVGTSAAKGLCEALDLPLVAISRLALLARTRPEAEVFALLDAGRGEFYSGSYLAGKCRGETLVSRDRALAFATEFPQAQFVGCEPAMVSNLPELRVELVPEPGAPNILAEAVSRIRAGDFNDLASLDANYVRRTDVEIFTKQIRTAAARP